MKKYNPEENDFYNYDYDYEDDYNVFDNPYYNEDLDMDQQSEEFWDNL